MSENPIRVVGISGSLRAASYNSGLLRAAAEVLPPGMTLEIADLRPLPMYDGDIEAAGEPEPVTRFKAQIAAADALLIATPEYNYSIPGVLKNAIDWASRPIQTSPFNGKPVAIMGAGGLFGTTRAQLHLRQIAVYLNLLPINKPEVRIVKAWEKFDDAGNLTDEATRAEVRALLDALAAWTRRLRGK
jgi:chromate reductase, NAD(P)H dehydrogenase (quinone)